MSDTRNDLPSPSAPNYDQRVRETLMTYMGRQGDPMDRGLTLRDLVDSGLVAIKDGVTLKPGQRVVPIKSGPAAGGSVIPDLTPPPTPTGFEVHPGMAFVMVEHDAAVFTQGHGYLRTVLYGKVRNGGEAAPVFAEAVKLAEFTGSVFSMPSEPATTWHLWIKWQTNDGVLSVDPAGGTNGLVATTGQDVAKLLEALTGEITSSQLYADLSSRIDLIDGPATMIGSVAARLRAQAEAGSQELNDTAKALRDEADKLADDFASELGKESEARIQGFIDESTERNTALLAQANTLGAAITSVDTARQTDKESFAQQINTLTGSLNSAVGAISSEQSLRIQADNVLAQDISTMAGRVGSVEGWITSKTELDLQSDTAAAAKIEALDLAVKDPVTGLPATRSLLVNSYSTTVTANSYVADKIAEVKGELTNAQTGIIASAISSEKIYSRLEADKAISTKITSFGTELRDPATGLIGAATSAKTIYSKTDADSAISSEVNKLRAEFTGPEGASSIADYTQRVVAKSDPAGAAILAANALKAELLTGKDGQPPLVLSKAAIEQEYSTKANATSAAGTAATELKTELVDPNTGLVANAVNSGTIYSKSGADGAISTEIKKVFAKYVDPATQNVSTAKMETELFASTTATNAIVEEIKKVASDFYDPASGKMTTAKVESAILTSTTATDAIATAVTNYKSESGKSISQIEVAATTAASDTSSLKNQYTVKLHTSQHNGAVSVAGFGLASEPNEAGENTSQFIVSADRFAIMGEPMGGFGEPYIPFIVQTRRGMTRRGDTVEPGVYIDAAFIKNGEIGSAKIGYAAIDDAHISNLSATKLTAGDGTIGDTLKSESYTETDGWILQRNGNAVFNNATVRGTVYATNGQFSGEIIAPGANGEMARMYSGNVEIHKNVPSVGVVVYKALSRMEVGVGANGTRVTIPGYFKAQPKIIVSPANIVLYNKNYASQDQSIQCEALNISESSPGSMVWGFTPKATLSLASNVGLAVINQESGITPGAWYSAEYTTQPNVSAVTPTVIVGSNRGNGVSQFFYRSVRWRVEYFDGANWITSMAFTNVNLGADTTATANSNATYTFPSAGTWTFRIYFEAYDTNGSVFGSAAYSYTTFTASNGGSAGVTTDSLEYQKGGTVSGSLSVSNPAQAGWEITGGTMQYSYSGWVSKISLAGGYASAPGFYRAASGQYETFSGSTSYSTTSTTIAFSATRESNISGTGGAGITVSAATLTLNARKAIANSTTANNKYSFQSYSYALASAQILATGTLNWVAVGD